MKHHQILVPREKKNNLVGQSFPLKHLSQKVWSLERRKIIWQANNFHVNTCLKKLTHAHKQNICQNEYTRVYHSEVGFCAHLMLFNSKCTPVLFLSSDQVHF